jgi:hypothetical protein
MVSCSNGYRRRWFASSRWETALIVGEELGRGVAARGAGKGCLQRFEPVNGLRWYGCDEVVDEVGTDAALSCSRLVFFPGHVIDFELVMSVWLVQVSCLSQGRTEHSLNSHHDDGEYRGCLHDGNNLCGGSVEAADAEMRARDSEVSE